ncbi:uncharacterized protein LOC108092850 isoform X2 [Drosophila ficusphila]|uniref:uncharacterized protein LOC108092850 isoform X2 n=1 Tax=Drosophila ficusphila TaxID=30025 RepID=UPI0007E6F6A0|nr:uncharacterized protein LOC108092850 isoform X2 [Drosophila ficusphila]
MGSIANAKISGFVCRICMQVHRNVLLFFGERAQQMHLVQKVKRHFSVAVSSTDDLPKTICHECIRTVNRFEEMQAYFRKLRADLCLAIPRGSPPSPVSDWTDDLAISDDSDSTESSDSFDFDEDDNE